MNVIMYSTALLGVCLSASLNAATVVRQQDGKGNLQTVTLTRDKVRLDAPQKGQYMLIDLTARKMYAVEPAKQQAVEMPMDISDTPAMPNAVTVPPPPPVEAELKTIGDGPDMLGMSTQKYEIRANGKVCSSSLVSEQAAAVAHIGEFMQTMFELNAAKKKRMANMPLLTQEPCHIANDKVEKEYLSKGMPLKSINAKGEVQFEVVSIEKDVEVADDVFTLPEGIKVMTEQQMMEAMQAELMKRMQKAQQQGQMPPPPVPPQPPAQ